jgi:hypothetical protein
MTAFDARNDGIFPDLMQLLFILTTSIDGT